MSQALVVAAYGQLNRIDKAQSYIKRLLELEPDYEASARERWQMRFGFQNDYLEDLLEGLRKAGLEIPDMSKSAD